MLLRTLIIFSGYAVLLFALIWLDSNFRSNLFGGGRGDYCYENVNKGIFVIYLVLVMLFLLSAAIWALIKEM